jgi:hypothetical protein
MTATANSYRHSVVFAQISLPLLREELSATEHLSAPRGAGNDAVMTPSNRVAESGFDLPRANLPWPSPGFSAN